jgi:hypothetical protein
MNLKRTAAIGAMVMTLLAGALTLPAPAVDTSPGAPAGEAAAIAFPEKNFEFQPVIEGVKVEHDFVVQNKGAAPLVIEKVKTG